MHRISYGGERSQISEGRRVTRLLSSDMLYAFIRKDDA